MAATVKQEHGWQLCGDYDERHHPDRAIAETKFDGMMCMTAHADGRLWNRPREKKPSRDVSVHFPEIVIPPGVVLLGEICILQNGVSQFHRLQSRMVDNPAEIRIRSRMLPATFVAFDVLWVNGQSFENETLEARRRTLNAVPGAYQTQGVFVPPYWDCPKEKVPELLELMRTSLAEGIIVKDLDARYKPGRGHGWMKVKAWEEFTADIRDMEVTANLGFVVYVDTPKGYRQKVVVNDTALQGRVQRREVTKLVVRYLNAGTQDGLEPGTGAMRQPHVAGVPYHTFNDV